MTSVGMVATKRFSQKADPAQFRLNLLPAVGWRGGCKNCFDGFLSEPLSIRAAILSFSSSTPTVRDQTTAVRGRTETTPKTPSTDNSRTADDENRSGRRAPGSNQITHRPLGSSAVGLRAWRRDLFCYDTAGRLSAGGTPL